jgi:hypothetical protein
MNNVGQHIIQEQDPDASIRYLAAQKQLYINGKSTFTFQVIIAVPKIPMICQFLFDQTWKAS